MSPSGVSQLQAGPRGSTSLRRVETYKAAGVDYDVLDAGKRVAVAAALATSPYSVARGVHANDASRGESAFLFELGGRQFATVLECLGTKSTIARIVQESTGENHFDAIAYDSVAAIVNDLICVGALPLVIHAYFATGSPDWYAQEKRYETLVEGWRRACEDSGATWGGGESPGLSGVVVDGEVDIAGSAFGAVPENVAPVLSDKLGPGDDIVFVAANGMHANGASMIRKLSKQLAGGYATTLPSGESLGASVLRPTPIYARLVEQLFANDVPVHYMSNITGHGLRKVMRADRDFTYRVTKLPQVDELFAFIGEQMSLDEAEMYGTFNMGCGFAIYSPDGQAVVRQAQRAGYEAWIGGKVESGPRQVIVEPIDVTYKSDALNLR